MKYYLSLVLLFFIFNSAAQVDLKTDAHFSIDDTVLSFFSPLPIAMPGSEKDTTALINLGEQLYFDTSLSGTNTQSCNSCHNILNGGAGVDHSIVSVGAFGEAGTRNAPSTWNAGLHFAQFWDGRAKTLEEQAPLPIFNLKEMGMLSETDVINKLNDKNYLTAFKSAFPNQALPINIENIAKALAAFQRTLISRDRFDDYLAGNKNAISSVEKNGLNVFINKGCVGCHNGPLLGGQLIMKMGLVNPYPNTIDKGRAQVTGNASDNFFFKVPSLRDVNNTPPYFHDGAVNTIEQAIKDTGWHQLGIKLNEEEVKAIKMFFNTMNNQEVFVRKTESTK